MESILNDHKALRALQKMMSSETLNDQTIQAILNPESITVFKKPTTLVDPLVFFWIKRDNCLSTTMATSGARRTAARGTAAPSLLLLVLLLVTPCWAQNFDEIAAGFDTTVEEILALGGVPDQNCTFAFNATPDNCDSLIGAYEGNGTAEPCDCYNFCNGQLSGCFDVGSEAPPEFTCDSIFNVVAGCQKGADKSSPLTPANITEPCPPGFMCTKEKQKSCEEIRSIPIELGLGDVHAGLYCPGREDREENGYQICESGHYCPNSTTMLPCPEGYFCPHKTAIPEIKCGHCPERARTLERKSYGYITVGVVFGVLLIMFLYSLFKRYNTETYARLRDLRGRNMDRVRAKIQKTRRQEKLKALQPKLKVIEERLKQNSQQILANASVRASACSVASNNRTSSASAKAINTGRKSGKIKLNPRRMFDLMDTNGDGELEYDEINVALALNPVQLREFIRRMNQAAKVPPETATISKDVFISCFLRVLEQISHFEPTKQEAEQLFDDILEQNGTIDLDGITHERLFDSPLADFLTEQQIHLLIKRFRTLQEKNMQKNLIARWKLKRNEMITDSDAENGNDIMGKLAEDEATQPAARKKRIFGGLRPHSLDSGAGAFKSSLKTGSEPRNIGMDTSTGSEGAEGYAPMRSSQRRRSTAMVTRQIRRASLHEHTSEGENHFNPYRFKRPGILTLKHKFDTISREEFIAWYPTLLLEVTADNPKTKNSGTDKGALGGVDIAFENLCLTVTVKQTEVKIVDRVTGRLRAGTMTALMGGSGAGKTSLLNALCGRAFYGEVTGIVKINGHEASIEEHASAVGFVPQDDIVYAELTVRENFVFSGKFQLPKGTPMAEIKDLADETMASLGLSRVMHSIVGDVTRRGVSGGEKKRVNIGLELMAKPRILFLDEPTSGLDSNSALLVMESLKTLVRTQGTTICSVIHQPRKFIFELFDSLILLGVGGKLVYHGDTLEAEQYFKDLHYDLPPGESIADWLIDISSGRLGPSRGIDESGNKRPRSEPMLATLEATAEDEETDNDQSLPSISSPLSFGESTAMLPALEVSESVDGTCGEGSESASSVSMVASMQDLVQPSLGEGPGANLMEDEAAKAKARREVLYGKWRSHFLNLSDEKRHLYSAPPPSDLPAKVKKTAFAKQLLFQLQRCIIVSQRNWQEKVIDTTIIIGAVVLVSVLDGTEEPTVWSSMSDLNYDRVAEPSTVRELVMEFPKLFKYAISANVGGLQGYAAKLGVLLSVLISLAAVKTVTQKRKEFFREAGSGYNVNAYFVAINITATIEHSTQCFLCGLCAIWLRNSLSSWYSFLVSFVLVGWIAVSWAFLFPLLVPLDNVVMVTGFYMVLFSLLFSGAIAPVLYKDIYKSDGLAIFSGLFSPTRYFIESLAVVESRCLPVQSGFTDFGVNFSGDVLQTASFVLVGLGLNDLDTISVRGYDGWYWGALPAFLVGLWIRWVAGGLIHLSCRPQQAKKPLWKLMNGRLAVTIFVYCLIMLGLLAASVWAIMRETSTVE